MSDTKMPSNGKEASMLTAAELDALAVAYKKNAAPGAAAKKQRKPRKGKGKGGNTDAKGNGSGSGGKVSSATAAAVETASAVAAADTKTADSKSGKFKFTLEAVEHEMSVDGLLDVQYDYFGATKDGVSIIDANRMRSNYVKVLNPPSIAPVGGSNADDTAFYLRQAKAAMDDAKVENLAQFVASTLQTDHGEKDREVTQAMKTAIQMQLGCNGKPLKFDGGDERRTIKIAVPVNFTDKDRQIAMKVPAGSAFDVAVKETAIARGLRMLSRETGIQPGEIKMRLKRAHLVGVDNRLLYGGGPVCATLIQAQSSHTFHSDPNAANGKFAHDYAVYAARKHHPRYEGLFTPSDFGKDQEEYDANKKVVDTFEPHARAGTGGAAVHEMISSARMKMSTIEKRHAKAMESSMSSAAQKIASPPVSTFIAPSSAQLIDDIAASTIEGAKAKGDKEAIMRARVAARHEVLGCMKWGPKNLHTLFLSNAMADIAANKDADADMISRIHQVLGNEDFDLETMCHMHLFLKAHNVRGEPGARMAELEKAYRMFTCDIPDNGLFEMDICTKNAAAAAAPPAAAANGPDSKSDAPSSPGVTCVKRRDPIAMLAVLNAKRFRDALASIAGGSHETDKTKAKQFTDAERKAMLEGLNKVLLEGKKLSVPREWLYIQVRRASMLAGVDGTVTTMKNLAIRLEPIGTASIRANVASNRGDANMSGLPLIYDGESGRASFEATLELTLSVIDSDVDDGVFDKMKAKSAAAAAARRQMAEMTALSDSAGLQATDGAMYIPDSAL